MLLTRAVATAQRLISKCGEVCQWSVAPTPITPDPAKPFIQENGVAGPPTPVSIVFKTDAASPLFELLQSSKIEGSGLKALLAAKAGLAPKIADTVIRSDGTKLALKSIDPLAPNGSPVLYFLVFRA